MRGNAVRYASIKLLPRWNGVGRTFWVVCSEARSCASLLVFAPASCLIRLYSSRAASSSCSCPFAASSRSSCSSASWAAAPAHGRH